MLQVSVVVPVLLWFCARASSLVERDVFRGKCKNFFAFPPDGLPSGGDERRYQQICQKQQGEFRFATLYDTHEKIPVFSAYRYNTYEKKRRRDCWRIEPGLESSKVCEEEMVTEKESTIKGSSSKQALVSDYLHSKYNRGHLYPVFHCKGQPAMQATCTLTNAAPQHPNFNKGAWKIQERKTAEKLDAECLGKGFKAHIVTGVLLGQKKIGNGVNVPSHFWSAHCCIDLAGNPVFSGAGIGRNKKNNNCVNDMTVTDLDEKLNKHYGFRSYFRVFGGKCQVGNF